MTGSKIQVPRRFTDPVTYEVMQKPVSHTARGPRGQEVLHTFEFDAIKKHLDVQKTQHTQQTQHTTCPLCRNSVTLDSFTPNTALKQEILAFCKINQVTIAQLNGVVRLPYENQEKEKKECDEVAIIVKKIATANPSWLHQDLTIGEITLHALNLTQAELNALDLSGNVHHWQAVYDALIFVSHAGDEASSSDLPARMKELRKKNAAIVCIGFMTFTCAVFAYWNVTYRMLEFCMADLVNDTTCLPKFFVDCMQNSFVHLCNDHHDYCNNDTVIIPSPIVSPWLPTPKNWAPSAAADRVSLPSDVRCVLPGDAVTRAYAIFALGVFCLAVCIYHATKLVFMPCLLRRENTAPTPVPSALSEAQPLLINTAPERVLQLSETELKMLAAFLKRARVVNRADVYSITSDDSGRTSPLIAGSLLTSPRGERAAPQPVAVIRLEGVQ